ncbi:SAM-dependent methyltransferase [Streptomyces tremellae]|uniref:SAM-dependent methyltransferase n=1 Tax=Streptomyces tremellae TaxID=1124239 RepID=A0ABP7EP80_9ACTN
MPHLPPRPKGQIDTSRPHSARVYDYLLGGKDNYAVDRELAEELPGLFRSAAAQNRAFMRRAISWLALRGIDQFLDIGTGIPTAPNLHQIAQRVNPAARVVYTDNDPIVLAHAAALLVSSPEGRTDYVDADLRAPEAILEAAGGTLDFDRPIALSLVAVLHFVTDAHDPRAIVRTLVSRLPAGSFLVLSHGDVTQFPEDVEAAGAYERRIEAQFRRRAEIEPFFDEDRLTLVPPGLVTAPEWYQADQLRPKPERSAIWAGVAEVGAG